MADDLEVVAQNDTADEDSTPNRLSQIEFLAESQNLEDEGTNRISLNQFEDESQISGDRSMN